MTVHAAKGLEFPIVFVVNLAKGASGPPRPVRVTRSTSQDEPSVSVGPFVSDTDEAEKERERHETRRLLYVALTRARDRLYLSSTLKDGAFVPGRGSLAEVLPESSEGASPAPRTASTKSTPSHGPASRARIHVATVSFEYGRRPQLVPQIAAGEAAGSRGRRLRTRRVPAASRPESRRPSWSPAPEPPDAACQGSRFGSPARHPGAPHVRARTLAPRCRRT